MRHNASAGCHVAGCSRLGSALRVEALHGSMPTAAWVPATLPPCVDGAISMQLAAASALPLGTWQPDKAVRAMPVAFKQADRAASRPDTCADT